MPEEPPIPSVLSFLLCDQIITEANTTKKSLIGLFDRLFVRSLPAFHPVVWVFAKLADAEGEYKFRVEVVRLESDRPVGRAISPNAEVPSRLQNIDLVLRLPIPFEELGTYEFQLYANDVWIGRTKLSVVMAGEDQ
jgi:hypothetical protein